MIKQLAFAFVITTCVACSPKTNTSTKEEPDNNATESLKAEKEYEKEKYIKAMVVDMSALDGCRFMLKLESGKKLEPDKMDQIYQRDNMNVWIKYSLNKGGASICMSGQMVTLIDIQLR